MWEEQKFQGDGITSIERKKAGVSLRLPLYQLTYIYIYIYMHEDCLIISNVNSASFWYLTDSSHQCQWKCTSFQSEAARRAGCRRIEMEEGKKLICFFSPTAAGGDSARVCLPTQKLTNYNWASTVTGKKWIFCWWENIRQVLVIVL